MDRGWRCVLLARGRERLEATAKEVGAEWETCDVGDRDGVADVARRVGERHDAVHLLVSNAGMPAGGGFLEIPPERIEQVTRTNYLGGVWALLGFLPLLERGAPSDVVNVASVAATVVGPTFGPYAASKHAQLAFSRASARELAPRGIRVHAVNPGPVPTPGFPQERVRSSRIARHTLASADDVAAAILRTVEENRREVFVPRPFRLAAAAQALVPGAVARFGAFGRWRP